MSAARFAKWGAGLRAVAVFEAAKGALVLAAGFGLLSLIHRNVQDFAGQLVAHLHLNPAKGYPRIFLDAVAGVSDARLWMLAALALAYAVVRWIEAYGLWRGRRWAEWFAAASGAIYVPAELYELAHGPDWMKVLLLTVNVCIVAYMILVLAKTRRTGQE
ncbi:MAG TPA: DUF2127 domain-containing protein [Burkholderiales bacterium]